MSLDYPKIDEVRATVIEISNFVEVEDFSCDVEKVQNRLIEFVHSTNKRLRKCDQLLRSGLRSEAIQEAETEPNLFDIVAELDFPAWDGWRRQVTGLGFAAQPELLFDIAADLNEAYNLQRPLEKLLRKHRVFALARSPLADRIPILRAIVEKDPENDLWRQDLAEYENARFRELEKELKASSVKQDFRVVKRIHSEIRNANWSVTPTVSLVEKVEESYQTLIAENAMSKLSELASRVDAAFSAFDRDKTTKLRTKWDNYFSLAAGEERHELNDIVSPAFKWLDEELEVEEESTRRRQAFANLEAALDDDQVTKAKILRLHAVADRFDEKVSNRLERRFNERIRRFEIVEKRKTFTVVTSILTLILTCAGLGIGLFMWQAAKSELANASESLTKMLDTSELQQADSYLTRLSTEKPSIANSIELQALRSRFEKMQEDESKRLLSFGDFLKQAEELTNRFSDTNSDPMLRHEFRAALKGLTNAEEVANGDAERLQVKELEQKVKSQQATFQSVIDGEFKTDVGEFANLIRGKTLNLLPPKQLARLLESAESLRLRDQTVSPEAFRASQLSLMIRRLEDAKSNATLAERLKQVRREIKRSIGDEANVEKAFEMYSALDTTSTRGSDYKTVLDRGFLEIASQTKRWNQLAAKWNLDAGKEANAKLLITLIDRIVNEFGFIPGAIRKVSNSKGHFAAISLRDPDAKLKTIVDRLRQTEFKFKYFEKLEDGKKYYFRKAPTVTNQSGYVEFELHDSLKNLSSTTLKKQKPEKLRKFNGLLFTDAPQSKFASDALEYLEWDSIRPFEEKVMYLLDVLVNDKTGIDEILRMKLILQFTALARSGSEYLNTELEQFEVDASGSTIGARTANYLDPTDNNANKIRSKCKLAIAALPNPREIFETSVQPILEKMETPRLPSIYWLGVADRSNGRIDAIYNLKFDRTLRGNVYVEIPSPKGVAISSRQLAIVGRFENGQLMITDESRLIEGVPLLLLVPAKGGSDE